MGNRQGVSDVDQVVGEHAEADPALHPFGTPVTTTVQAMATFDDADPSLTPGSPRLRFLKPATPF
jgi:hypothetical protein